MIVDVLYLVLCSALLYSCFCRAARINKRNTLRSIRWAFQALSVAVTAALAAPFVWGHQPDWVEVSLLAAFFAVQAVTAHHWHHGVPLAFQPEARHGHQADSQLHS